MSDAVDGSINFPFRFFVDEHFIQEILKDKSKAESIISHLSHIHRKSRFHPLSHNLIFDQSFKNAIKDKLVRGQALIGAMHPEPFPDFIKEEDFNTKLIKYAIHLASTKKPYRFIILTSPEKAVEYTKNPNYSNNNVQNAVTIASGSHAEKMIEFVSSLK